jgi:hypothetical protein
MIVCLFVYYCLGDDCLSFCLLLSWGWLFVLLSIIVLGTRRQTIIPKTIIDKKTNNHPQDNNRQKDVLFIIVLGMIVCRFVYYCLGDDCLSFCLLVSWRWLFVFLSIIVLGMIVGLFVYYCLGDDCLSFCLLLSNKKTNNHPQDNNRQKNKQSSPRN